MRRTRFHRKLLLFGLILALAIGSSVQGEDQLPPEEKQALEQEYIQAIRPQIPDPAAGDVISSGYVIVYGQTVAPPYRLTVSGDTLLLNGVRIDPPIMPPWKHRVTEITDPDEGDKEPDVTQRIASHYGQLVEQGAADIQQEILNYISEKEATVRIATWRTSEKLRLVMATGEEFSIRLAEPEPAIDYREIRKDIVRSLKDRYETDLTAGALLVLGYGPVLLVPESYVEATMEQIDTKKGEGSIARLAEVLNHEELAREMLFIINHQVEED